MASLSSPIHMANIRLSHRIVMAPLTRLRSDEDHIPLPMAIDYYSQRASISGTLLISEATFVSFQHSGRDANAPGIFNQVQIDRWKEITSVVHAKGSFIFCQLWALGRAARPHELKKKGLEMLSSSATPMTTDPNAPHPRAMNEDEIWQCIRDFAQAAKNAIAAGFDGIEIHAANGYLIDQFTQDSCNHRTDAWGGSVEKRARFAVEVAKAVVEAIGSDRVGIRLSPWSTFQAMKMKDPKPQFECLIKKLAKLRLAYLHLVESRVAGNADVDASDGLETLDFAVRAWDKASPILLAGGYKPDSAQKAVEEYAKLGQEVAIVFGRYFISNPDLPFRVLEGVDLVKYDRATFYEPKSLKGYVDYPFCREYLEVIACDSAGREWGAPN